jgi:hypothetical protein
VVEGARLESVYTRKGIEGSNPSLSAESILSIKQRRRECFVYILQKLKDFLL